MLNVKQIKRDFPIFKRKINGRELVYLDSASTSQKPRKVIDAVFNLYRNSNANIHRGIYTISEEATALFEKTREKFATFINAKSEEEIVFTHNTTEALNIIAYGLGQTLKEGDSIVISEMEHHSNIVPWQRIAKEKRARLLFIAIDDNGILADSIVDDSNTALYHSIGEISNLKIVSLTHISNVLGTINPIETIVKDIKVRNKDVTIVVDAAQSAPHMKIDVQKLDCDFLAFSGHKMLGPTGVGVLWGRKELLERMEPLFIGSHMIKEVTKKGATWNDLPWKFEPGTAAIEAVIGLGAAIDYLNEIGIEEIQEHEKKLVTYCLSCMKEIDGLTIYGPKLYGQYTGIPDIARGGVVSFNINGVHAHDIAQILDSEGICIRSGHHCAMPLHQRLGVPATARASFYLYNDEEDVDKLIAGIHRVKKLFKR